jgi:L-fucose isomerase-like protein
MNQIKLYRIESNIPNIERKKENDNFIDEINMFLNDDGICLDTDTDNYSINVVLVESGGSEGAFVKLEEQLTSPVILLDNGKNNSLAANFEIKTYLSNKNKLMPIHLTGDADKIARSLKEISLVFQAKKDLNGVRLGVIGKPSDWLIASNVNYLDVKERFGIELIDIDYDEFKLEIDKKSYEKVREYDELANKVDSIEKLEEALYVYGALKRLTKKYKLSGLTVRCFDLLDLYKTTSCLALALLNKRGIIAGCEGDIPTLLTMTIINKLTGFSSFQANPSYIFIEKGEILFAHCTLPLDMCSSYSLDTHFESDMSIGIKGEFSNEHISILKLSSDLKTYYAGSGEIISSPNIKGYCRSQLIAKLDRKSYIDFFSINYGNHVVITYGDIINQFITLIEVINQQFETPEK